MARSVGLVSRPTRSTLSEPSSGNRTSKIEGLANYPDVHPAVDDSLLRFCMRLRCESLQTGRAIWGPLHHIRSPTARTGVDGKWPHTSPTLTDMLLAIEILLVAK